MDDALELVAQRIAAGGRNVALTGAGISVESGVPDFRSAGGLWEKFDPMEYATIEAFEDDPVKVWRMLREMEAVIHAARPNPAHLALARLEALGLLAGVITQNIDNLHQAAGSKTVIEFHGNVARLVCLACGLRLDAGQVRAQMAADGQAGPPACPACDTILKPDVVFFGEPIPVGPGQRAMELSEGPSVFLVIGTSGTVAPASYLPVVARKSGALVVEVNPEPTPLSGTVAQVSLHGPAGHVLPALLTRVEGLLGSA